MKCDLCRHRSAPGSLLCVPCGEMIRRLITIETRLRNADVSEADRLRCECSGQSNAASNPVSTAF